MTGVIAIAALAVIAAGLVAVLVERHDKREAAAQAAIAPFYEGPYPQPPGPPGTLIRSEPVGFAPSGSQGWRILYWSEGADGVPVVSSGMLFVPATEAPPDGRVVVAWAHGTVGMGPECAPSRSDNPLSSIDTFLPLMLANGWAVVATDYAGLGTPGVQAYLVGRSEAKDVLNSVRAANRFTDAAASSRFVMFGHSQGGHSVLWATAMASTYAPELQLEAAAAAAPAAEIGPLMELQAETVVGWAIGAEVMVSWPIAYPQVSVTAVASPQAAKKYRSIAERCIGEATLDAEFEKKVLGDSAFSINPMSDSAWAAAARSETPPPPMDVPFMVAQSTADKVVLPSTTASLVQRACAAGTNLSATWIGKVSHQDTGLVSGPGVTVWLQQRIAGQATTPTCGTTSPVAPVSFS